LVKGGQRGQSKTIARKVVSRGFGQKGSGGAGEQKTSEKKGGNKVEGKKREKQGKPAPCRRGARKNRGELTHKNGNEIKSPGKGGFSRGKKNHGERSGERGKVL